ncbi:MAG: SBBP repeat-containing protein [Ignavibacteria bacterium]|nr:SBBP repeat-containing protein [Ignavibacteria bacterium]
MKKQIYALVFIIFILTSSLYAQVSQEWVARYNGPGNGEEWAHSLAVDDSGNAYVTGSIMENGTSYDYATIKYNSAGIQQWIAIYNGPGNANDDATAIAVDGSGNIYVTGQSAGSQFEYNYATIKYNSAGVQQWVARYNGPGIKDSEASSIVVDGLGNIYVTGKSITGIMYYDYVTIKYNSAGVQQWAQIYNGLQNGDDIAYSIAVDGYGNVYVTGQSKGIGTEWDYATIKYNSSGVQQWVQRYNGPGISDDYAYSLTVDRSGNVYVTGYSNNYGSGTNLNYATIKYNSSGIQQWAAIYNGPENGDDIAHSITVDSSGNVYVTGKSRGNGLIGYATIKYNAVGVEQWVARYPGSSNSASSLAVDGSGNVYVTGTSWESGTGNDYATIKYNSMGEAIWVQRYNGAGNGDEYASSLKVDRSGNVYVTGSSKGSGTGYDYATIKYSQQVGIQNISTETPLKYALSQNYPNPFNPITNVKFSIINSGQAKLIVYDVQGREIQTLVNEPLKPGTYETTFDGSKYTSGVYFYRLTAEGYSETKRMALIK